MAVGTTSCVQNCEVDHNVSTRGAQTQFAATTDLSHAASPLKPAPSAVQNALHVSWIGALHWNGKRRWKKSLGLDQTDGGPRDMAELDCKTPTSSGRPTLAGIRRRFVQPRRRFDKQRQARRGSSTPLRSDLAQKTRPTSTREPNEKVGTLRGGTGNSRQVHIQTSQLEASLREFGRPERSLKFLQHHLRNSQTL